MGTVARRGIRTTGTICRLHANDLWHLPTVTEQTADKQRSKNWLGGYPQISENLFWLPELSRMVPTQPYMLTSILSRNLDNRVVPTCIVHTEPLFLRYVQQRNKLHLVPIPTRWPKTTRHGLLIYFILVCSV